MEYVNILSMIMDSDTRTTKEYQSLFNSVPTEYFADSSLISDEPIVNKTKDGRYICLYKEDDSLVLDYLTDGTGTLKSCTKKVKLEFARDLLSKLTNLASDKITSLEDDILNYRQLVMIATRYDLKRDTVNPNYIHEKELYTIYYFLRKNKENRYYLHSEIWPSKSAKQKNFKLNNFVFFTNIKPTFQRILNNGKAPFLSEDEELEELKDLYEFDDNFEDDEDCKSECDTCSDYDDGYDEGYDDGYSDGLEDGKNIGLDY